MAMIVNLVECCSRRISKSQFDPKFWVIQRHPVVHLVRQQWMLPVTADQVSLVSGIIILTAKDVVSQNMCSASFHTFHTFHSSRTVGRKNKFESFALSLHLRQNCPNGSKKLSEKSSCDEIRRPSPSARSPPTVHER